MKKLDIVLINPGNRLQIYQKLGSNVSAIEPPFWIGIIAGFLKRKGYAVEIIDCNAENLSPDQTAEIVKDLNPVVSAVIVYGSQPSASTQTMTSAGNICKSIKSNTIVPVAIGGLHPSALPEQTAKEEIVDYVIDGEGPLTLSNLVEVLKSGRKCDLNKVPGLWYWSEENDLLSNRRESNISIAEEDMPVTWELLPMDRYRAHNWHCFDDIDNRMPYAVVYTSLGCPFNCIFCCINTPFGKPGIRYRSPEAVINEIDILVHKYNVRNIKIPDELFVLHENHYMRIVDLLLERKYDLNIWVYARVDTVREKNLEKMKRAGINWFALGIESASPEVRDGASKKMKENDIISVVKKIQEADIRVIGNYIFGLPDDNDDTMRQTLDLSVELNCEFANFYSAMAYPGSGLYSLAKEKEWLLPDVWHGYSQHSYETMPLPTKYISAQEVLEFRDKAFTEYFTGTSYLNMIEKKFGTHVRNHITETSKTKLRRKILENN